MPLIKQWGAKPDEIFNDVLNDVYDFHVFGAHMAASATGIIRPDEPSFVQRLVSADSISELNRAAANCYDFQKNAVYFRGGFLHARPCAAFFANDKSAAGGKNCLRELADALFVLYVTAPDPKTGAHVVHERRACLLMFKCSKARKRPSTPRFTPGQDNLPTDDSDKEQFYLFNQWPDFKLLLGNKSTSPSAGSFSLRAVGHDIGKYALVWDYDGRVPGWNIGTQSGGAQQACWLHADPVPQHRISLNNGQGSLGYLLDKLCNGMDGKSFTPTAPVSTSNGWNELMGLLLGYYGAGSPPVHIDGHLEVDTWGGLLRDANPAAIQFLGGIGQGLEQGAMSIGEWYSHLVARLPGPGLSQKAFARLVQRSMLRDRWNWSAPFYPDFYDLNADQRNSLPVLVATVHSPTPWEPELRRG